jgi:hypothetical protein
MKVSLWKVAVFACGALASCESLPRIERGSCGNGVVEEGEDCDGSRQGEARCNPPESASACRFSCIDTACPAGLGCGLDGVCRGASGAFESGALALPGTTYDVRRADLDGDGRDDVVALRAEGLVAATFGDEGVLSSAVTVPGVTRIPTIGDLDGDARDDLVWARGGLGVAMGAATGPIVLDPYPAFGLPGDGGAYLMGNAVVEGTAAPGASPLAGRGDEGVLWEAGKMVTLVQGTVVTLAPFAVNPSDWRGAALGNVIPGNSSPCDELVVAHKLTPTSTMVSVVSLCQSDGGSITTNSDGDVAPFEIALPESDSVPGGVLLADVDRDGALDIVLRGSESLYVAYADGLGGFRDGPCGTGELGKASKSLPSSQVLALADLNDDGRVDVVEQTGVRLSSGISPVGCETQPFVTVPGPSTMKAAAPASESGWSHAAIGDFDGDGRPDLVALPAKTGSGLDTGIDFFASGGDGTFAYTRVEAGLAADALAIGDFDGDHLTDVVLLANHDGQAPRTDVAVLFGRPFSSPGELTSLGSLPGVSEVLVGDVVTGQGMLDLPDDIVIASALAEGAARSVAIFLGTSSRQLVSPLLTPPLDGGIATVPVAAAMGRFVAPDQLTVATVSLGNGVGHDKLWLATNDSGTLSFDEVAFLPPTTAPDAGIGAATGLPTARLGAALLAAVDLDGDRRDEGFVLGFGAPNSPTGTLSRVAGANEGGIVTVASPLAFAIMQDGPNQPQKPGSIAFEKLHSQALAHDFDGDGGQELVALGIDLAAGGPCGGLGALLVATGDGAGQLDLESALLLYGGGAAGDQTIVAFDAGQLDADPSLEFAVLTRPVSQCAAGLPRGGPTRLWVVDLEPTGNSPAAWQPTWTEALVDGGGLPSAESVAVGDADGDGVSDLFIGAVKGLFVLRGRDRIATVTP